MIWHLFDTIIIDPSKHISTGKCRKPVPATFNIFILAPKKARFYIFSKSSLFKISNTFWSQNRKKEKLKCTDLTFLNCCQKQQKDESKI